MENKYFTELAHRLQAAGITTGHPERNQLTVLLNDQPVLFVSSESDVFLLPAGSNPPEASELYHKVAQTAEEVYAYDKHIYCGECGSLCRKKITGGKTYWVCRRHDGDRANCPIPQIPEPEITAAVLRLYHKLKFGQETVLRPALSQLQELRERELRSNRKISDIDNEIARISEQNLVLVRLKSKGYVDSALYLTQMYEIDHKLRELRKLRRRLLEAAGEDRQIHDTERMMEYLEDGPEWLDEVPSDLFGELLDRIIIISPERLKFRLLNGMELSENIERMVR